MTYRQDLWEVAATHNGVVTIAWATDMGVPAVEVRKLASRGFLRPFGQGVYTHRDVPSTPFTQPTIAVALAGPGGFLHRDAVLNLWGLGQLNPLKIKVATGRRVRRKLPAWMELSHRSDVPPSDITEYEGIPSTTVSRAIDDIRGRISPDRWHSIVEDALARYLIMPDDSPAREVSAA
jgi:predicted transcriptional regulator of viral defense system